MGRRFTSQIGNCTVRKSSGGDSDEMLTLIGNYVAVEVVREFLGYNSKREDISYMEVTITSVARPHAWVATVVSRLMEKKRGGHRQK